MTTIELSFDRNIDSNLVETVKGYMEYSYITQDGNSCISERIERSLNPDNNRKILIYCSEGVSLCNWLDFLGKVVERSGAEKAHLTYNGCEQLDSRCFGYTDSPHPYSSIEITYLRDRNVEDPETLKRAYRNADIVARGILQLTATERFELTTNEQFNSFTATKGGVYVTVQFQHFINSYSRGYLNIGAREADRDLVISVRAFEGIEGNHTVDLTYNKK